MESNRIIYDADELKLRLEQNLDTLERIRTSAAYAQQLGQDFIGRAAAWAGSIRRQKDQPFTVVVCGEFKRGKSSLINALLGEDVAATDVLPETMTLNRISYGEHCNALVLPGGRRMLLDDEQLRREKLEALLQKQEAGVYQLEIKRPIELLRHICIVDTPGTEDSLKDFTPMVHEAIRQADAVMYVFSVNYPISRMEQLFIKTVLLPQKHTELMLIGNFADMLRTQDGYARMGDTIRRRLEVLLPGMPFHMLSALDERCRQMNTERPCPGLTETLQDSFQSLRDQLSELIEEKSSLVLPERMERMVQGLTEELGAQLDMLEQGVSMDREKLRGEREQAEALCAALEEKQAATERHFSEMLHDMYLETLEWMSALVSSMTDELDAMKDMDTADIRKYYVAYCVDTLQDALSRCADCHLDRIYEEVNGVSEQLAGSLSMNVTRLPKQNFRFVLHNSTWTKGDSFCLGANAAANTGLMRGVLSLVSLGAAGIMRDWEMRSKKDTVLQDISGQLAEVGKSLPKTLRRYYDQMGSELIKQLQDAFTEQIRTVRTNAERMTEAASRRDEEKQQVQQTIAEVRSLLASLAL